MSLRDNNGNYLTFFLVSYFEAEVLYLRDILMLYEEVITPEYLLYKLV